MRAKEILKELTQGKESPMPTYFRRLTPVTTWRAAEGRVSLEAGRYHRRLL